MSISGTFSRISSNIEVIGGKTTNCVIQGARTAVHKLFGTLSTPNIIKTADKLGKDVLDLRCQKSVITSDDLLDILRKNFGVKKVKNIEVVTNEQDLIKFMQKKYNFGEKECADIVESCSAMVIPSLKNGKTYLFIPQKMLINTTPEGVSIITHELEHIAYCLKSLYFKLYNLIPKRLINMEDVVALTRINESVYNNTISNNQRNITHTLSTQNFVSLCKLLCSMKDEVRAFRAEDEIYNFIQKKYRLPADKNRICIRENFEKTCDIIKETIKNKYFKFIPNKLSTAILDKLN